MATENGAGKDISKLEKRVHTLLEKEGIEYIVHPKINVLVGESWRRLEPDILIPSMRLAIEVNGCYVHGCPECYGGPGPQSRLRKHNQRVRALERSNYNVLTLWACELEEIHDQMPVGSSP